MTRAEELVREIKQDGIDAHVDSMMHGYAYCQNDEKCLIVFERLKESGFRPSVISDGCLINCHVKDLLILQSKGLEWNVVFIVKANDSEIPLLHEYNGISNEGGFSLEDERRLF